MASTPPNSIPSNFLPMKHGIGSTMSFIRPSLRKEVSSFTKVRTTRLAKLCMHKTGRSFIESPPREEFYANLVDAKRNKCFARGKRVPFDAKTIDACYGTINIAADTWSSFAEQEDVDAVT